jgi:ribosomal protein S12 methylthiotransferase accessory factor
VAGLNDAIQSAGARLLLFLLPTVAEELSTFWAVLLDQDNPRPFVRVNLGYGAHLSSEIAAVRAITEAAQSRMAFLHGCREDMAHRIRRPHLASIAKASAYFASFVPSVGWSDAARECLGDSIVDDYKKILAAVRKAGFSRVLYRTIESVIPRLHIVRVLVPGTLLKTGVF